jgi:hypothetical protein
LTARVPGFVSGTQLTTPLLDPGSEFLGGRLYDRGQDDSVDILAPVDVVLDDMRYSIAMYVLCLLTAKI